MIRYLYICAISLVLLLSGCVLPMMPTDLLPPSPTIALYTPTTVPQPSPVNTSTQTPISPPAQTPTPVPTATLVLQPSSTSTHTLIAPTPSYTTTPIPTNLVPPTITSTHAGPPDLGEVIYAVQPGTPLAMTGFPHPELGCNWMGIGGQVFAYDGTPVLQLVVQLSGKIGGKDIDIISVTGSATLWGQGGYELKIADTPIESSGSLWVEFLALNGVPVSDRIYITTFNDCGRNTILLNMKQVKDFLPYRLYLPLIQN